MKKLLCGFLVLVYSIPAMAVIISGTVQDTEGNPLGGAHIVFSGDETKGESSDKNGHFNKEFKDVPDDGEFKISYMGYADQTLNAKDLNNATITMVEESKFVADVVIKSEKLADEAKGEDTSAETVSPTDGGEEVVDEEPEEEVIEEEPEEDLAGAGLNPVTPRLSQQESEQKVSELRDNYNAVKANEQSLENRTLGAAAMATVGAGGQMTASSLSEQKSDADAERDMAAYLATFRCDWGSGRNVRGGETNVELPGAGQLIPLYSEYVTLANDLKLRKAQLGLKAGIESEPILDSATTGLYDDVSTGISSGAYASLARALQNPNGADAKMWAEQKEKTAENLKTGIGLVATGVAASVAGNAIINRDAPRDRSREIIAEFESLFSSLEEDVTSLSPTPCSGEGVSGGTYPKCTCKNDNERYSEKNGCQPCPLGRHYDKNNYCVPDTPAAVALPNCNLTGAVKEGICQCADNAVKVGNQCTCKANFYEYTDPDWGTKSCICLKLPKDKVNPETCTCKSNYVEDGLFCEECPKYQTYKDGTCVDIMDAPTEKTEDITQSTSEEKVSADNLSTDKLFEPSSDKINTDNGAHESLENFAQRFVERRNNGSLGTEYCIHVVGHTDRTGWKKCKEATDPNCSANANQLLSENRARAVASVLKDKGINPDNICAVGRGQIDCKEKEYERDDKNCRRVDVSLSLSECPGYCWPKK